MKASGRSFSLAKPDPAVQAVLLTGPDPGVSSEAAQELIRGWSNGHAPDPERLTLLGEGDLGDRDRLVDALLGPGLFGSGTPVVRLVIESQRGAAAIIATLEDIASGRLSPAARWVIEFHGELKPSAGLRRAFEAASTAVCIALPVTSQSDASGLIRSQLRDRGVSIESDAVDYLAATLCAHRSQMRSEVEKLSVYGRSLRRTLTLTDIDAIVCTNQTGDARNAAFAAVSGGLARADGAAEHVFSAGGSAISLLRSLHFASVFAFRRQRSMSASRLAGTLGSLWRAEKLAKTTPFPAHAAWREALREICALSGEQRREKHSENQSNRKTGRYIS